MKDIQEKTRFFAQYWGQEYIFKKGVGIFKVDKRAFPLCDGNDEALLLKSLNNITDDDRNEVMSLGSSIIFYNSNRQQTDYLRSKGYALPFMNYSVDELVQMGWVELF